MKRFGLKLLLSAASSITLAIGLATSAQAEISNRRVPLQSEDTVQEISLRSPTTSTSQSVSATLDHQSALETSETFQTQASALGAEPIAISTAASTRPTAIPENEVLADLMLLSQNNSDRSGQTSPNTATPAPAQPGQPLETVPAPSNSSPELPSPLDPSPTIPERSDIPGQSTPENQQDNLPPGTDTTPPGTQDVVPPGTNVIPPGTQTPGSAVPDETEPYRIPNSELPAESTPAGVSPTTTSQQPGVDEEPPPGTFTPDTRDVSPGRTTRSGPSYIGIGGNIGLGSGDTALGEGSFSVFSKVGLTRNISVRPAVLISDSPTILLPVTLDLIPIVTDVTEDVSERIGLRVSPYIGAGAAFSTGDDFEVDFLATAGVDVPITSRFTATASVNASLFDNPAVGLLLGVGYNF